MSDQPRLFRVNPEQNKLEAVKEAEFSELDLGERQHIQEWVADHPDILDDDLLIIAKEYAGFDLTNERADLVAVDRDGTVVIIELKRDDTGADVHWQAIKYASYFQTASADEIIRLLAEYSKVEHSVAESRLQEHLEADDLGDLNRRQRIILASHRFAPEVTSAVLWLNDQAIHDLITCVKLTPHRDQADGSLYLQATTFLPITGAEGLQVGLGSVPANPHGPRGRGKKDDPVTLFMRQIYQEAANNLEDNLTPDRRSRWAGVGGDHRYLYIWYSTPPLDRYGGLWFKIMLYKADGSGNLKAVVEFTAEPKWAEIFNLNGEHVAGFLQRVIDVETGLGDEFKLFVKDENKAALSLQAITTGDELGSDFRERIVELLVSLIQGVQPAVENLSGDWPD